MVTAPGTSMEEISYFSEAGRGKTLLHIINRARFNPGVIGLMGDEGSGRSRLIEKLVERVNQKQGFAAVISRSVKTRTDLYEALKECLSIESTDDVKPDEMAKRIDDFLQVTTARHRPVIIAIDDIQQFSLSMLEELIRIVAGQKRMTLLLVGDKNLGEMLKRLDTATLSCHSVALEKLSEGEVRQFLNWRLPHIHLKDSEFQAMVANSAGNLGLLERAAAQIQSQKGAKSKSAGVGFSQKKSLWLLLALLALAGAGAGVFYYQQQQPVKARPVVVETPVVETVTIEEEAAAPEPVPEVEIEPLKPVIVEAPVQQAEVEEVVVPPPPAQKPVEVQKLAEVPKPVEVQKTVEAPRPVTPPKPAVVATEKTAPEKTAQTDDTEQLLALPAKSYSIQVLGAQSAAKAKKFIDEHADLQPLYFFRSTRDGKDWYVVMYGVYDNRQQAIDATAALPDDIRTSSPWARRLSEVHGLIRARSPE